MMTRDGYTVRNGRNRSKQAMELAKTQARLQKVIDEMQKKSLEKSQGITYNVKREQCGCVHENVLVKTLYSKKANEETPCQ
jgi:hypothetical protein